MTWQMVLGPLTGAAIGALFAIYIVSVLRRERRGPAPVLATLSTSRPVWGMSFVIVAFAAASLVVVRLGLLS